MGPPAADTSPAAPAGGWLRRNKPPPPQPADPAAAAYDAHRRTTDLGFPYRVPAPFLAGTRPAPPPPPAPETPLLVFVNAAAGGRAGPALAAALRRALGADQVFDVAAHKPADVLRALYANLDARASAGDFAALSVRSRLVLLVAGGDGTVAWVLKTVADLGLDPPPAVAVMPLGTGNDLALSFGWGHRYTAAWAARHDALYATLKRVADGEPRDLDAWRVSVARPAGAPPFEGLPHALEPDTGNLATAATAAGRFWNYLSVGNDAQATHGFHTLRDARPWAAPTRIINQAWYVMFGCLSGWFCGAPPARRRLALRVRRGEAGPWVDVKLPRGVRVVALLNLQSYAGGRDVWGLRDTRDAVGEGAAPARRPWWSRFVRSKRRGRHGTAPRAERDGSEDGEGGFADASPSRVAGQPAAAATPPATLPRPATAAATRPATAAAPSPTPRPGADPTGRDGWDPPIFNDGLVEVVGLRSGWHAGVAFTGLFPTVHGVRLAQASAVELSFSGDPAAATADDDCVYMQVDGEPWRQPIPAAGAPPLVVTVTHAGVSSMLVNTTELGGVPKRVRQLAARERSVSLSTQVSLGRGLTPSPARAAALELTTLRGGSPSPPGRPPLPPPVVGGA